MLRFTTRILILAMIAASVSASSFAGENAFHAGKVIPEFGQTARVRSDFVIPPRAKFKVLFDTSKGAQVNEVNKTLGSAARFLNMHAEAGVAPKNMKIAIVFHGQGSFDVTRQSFYAKKFEGAQNANAAIVKALTEQGVRIIVCGQTAAHYDIANEDLLPGVEMALSAMTAHALLQQEGYTLNPF